MTSESVRITFDDALTHYIGEFGRGQRQLVAILSLFGISNGFVLLLWVMVTIDPIRALQWRCTDPGDLSCSAVHAAPTSQDFCQLPAGSWQWTSQDSLVAQLNLHCGNSWKVQFANTLLFIGGFLGSGLFGALSDKIGRKNPLFIATTLAAVATFLSIAVANYWFIAVMRLVAGMGAAAQIQGVVLLSMETTGRSYRGIAGILVYATFCVGEYFLVGTAVAAPNWRSLFAVAGTICAATLFLYPVIPESARWLMGQQGKQDQALEILRNLSVKNGSRMPQQYMLQRSRSLSAKPMRSTALSMFLGKQLRSKSMPALRSSNSNSWTDVDGNVDVQSSIECGIADAAPEALCSGTKINNSSETASSSAGCNSMINVSGQQVATVYQDVGDATAADRYNEASTAAADCAGKYQHSSDHVESVTQAASTAAAPVTLRQLVSHRTVAIMSVVTALNWYTNFITYYTILLGMGKLPGSIYTTFALNVTGQIVATLLAGALVDKLGRHNVISMSLTTGGIACLMTANTSDKVAQIVLATLGQFGCSASVAVTPTYSAELYPTSIRSTALGICNKACRLGCISAPLLILLGQTVGGGSAIFLPYIVCGVLCCAVGVMVLFMPETSGGDMPETVQDLHKLQTVFSAKPWRQGGALKTVAFLFRARATVHADSERDMQHSEETC